MLGQEWVWQVNEEKTPNPDIKKVIVRVFESEAKKEQEASIVTIEGYLM
jgi:hypothetical protein